MEKFISAFLVVMFLAASNVRAGGFPDFDHNGEVGISDLVILASVWLTDPSDSTPCDVGRLA